MLFKLLVWGKDGIIQTLNQMDDIKREGVD
jgi:hypothetical protein